MIAAEAKKNRIRGSSRAAAPGMATTGLPMIKSALTRHEAEEPDLTKFRNIRDTSYYSEWGTIV